MQESISPKFNGSTLALFLRQPILLQRESALFLMTSALDVFMTYILLKSSGENPEGPHFYESNPVTGFILYSWGLTSVIYFKFLMVAVVEVIAQIIAAKQIDTARRVLEFGTLIVGCVVIYSLMLFVRHSSVM
jgi:hypothetical protein